jgi:hypothetical protein
MSRERRRQQGWLIEDGGPYAVDEYDRVRRLALARHRIVRELRRLLKEKHLQLQDYRWLKGEIGRRIIEGHDSGGVLADLVQALARQEVGRG